MRLMQGQLGFAQSSSRVTVLVDVAEGFPLRRKAVKAGGAKAVVKSLRRVQGRRTLACDGELVVSAAGRKFIEASSGVGCRPEDNNVSRLS